MGALDPVFTIICFLDKKHNFLPAFIIFLLLPMAILLVS